MITSCTETARRIGMSIAPSWNDRTMRKNKLDLTKQNLSTLFKAEWTHLYIKTNGHNRVHECIINKNHSGYTVYDSYINYRSLTIRSFTYDKFHTDISSLDGQILARLLDLPMEWTGPVTGWFVILQSGK